MNLKIPTTIIFENLENSQKFITVNQGGARSSKTYNEVLWLIRVALCPDIWVKYKINKPIISICRETLPALKASAYRDFLEIMTNNHLYNPVCMNKSDLIYTFETGSMLEFFSLDDPQKLKSRKRDFLLVPECNENDYETIRQLLLRTTSKAIFDFNPSEDFWIFDKIITRPDAELFITTYKNNPFLDERIKQEIERLEFEDENAWKIYGLGERGQRQELIYPNVEYLDNFNGIEFEETIFGLDFGYNNPTALIEVSLKDKCFYEKERLYQSFMTNGQLIEWLKNNLTMSEKRYCIYADAAEPQRIKELNDAGFYVKPADKSVKDGIDFCKRFKTFCLNSDINNKKEKKNYSWKKDKNNNILDEPIKFFDHLCFSGETLISTIDGFKFIKDIKIGDLVLTSNGYKKVLNSGCSGVKNTFNFIFSNGILLRATKNHPLIINKTKKSLDALRYSDIIISINSLKIDYKGDLKCQKLLKLMGLNFIDIQTQKLEANEYIIAQQIVELNTGLEDFTNIFGLKNLVKNQKDMLSITKTGMLLIIIFQILNALKKESTYQIISKEFHDQCQLKLLLKLLNGIKQKLEYYGISNKQKNIDLENGNLKNLNVIAVEKVIKQELKKIVNIALMLVDQNKEDEQVKIISKEFAQFVQFLFQLVNILNPNVVQKNVLGFSDEKIEKVYNLTVETDHEYFANGILVSNCDAGRYAKFTYYKDAFGKNIDSTIRELELQLDNEVDYGDFRDDY